MLGNIRLFSPADYAFWEAVNTDLSRRSEPEAIGREILMVLDTEEDAESAAEFIAGQRWLARTAA